MGEAEQNRRQSARDFDALEAAVEHSRPRQRDPAEAQKVDKTPLQPITGRDKSLMATYDAPPYVPAGYNNSFPFVDFGNKYVIGGASYDPALLANLSWSQVAADLANPSSTVGRAIDATANRITAAICTMTGNKPGDVCTSTGVISASGSI